MSGARPAPMDPKPKKATLSAILKTYHASIEELWSLASSLQTRVILESKDRSYVITLLER